MSEIKNRHTWEIICSGECSVKELAETNKTNLYRADLRGADLRGADLRGADLDGADLFRANLRGANLREANLFGANLYGADLRGADLRVANLRGANLCRADLNWADLRWADLNGADLRWADLREADLFGAKYGEETLLKYLSIGTIGSRNDVMQVFITIDNIHLRTGCWSGTPEGLLEDTEREDYRLAVQYIVSMAEMVRKEVQGE